MTDQLETVIERMADGYEQLVSRVDQLEVKGNRPANPMAQGEKRMTPEQREHVQLFEQWVRNPKSQTTMQELENCERHVLSKNMAVTVGTDSAGGYAVPEVLANEINQKLRDHAPIRQIAHVQQVGSSDFKEVIDTGGTSSGWVGENDARSETDTANFEEIAPTFGIVYSYPKVSEEAYSDVFFDVQSWLSDRVSEELGIAEDIAFISGNGTKKPTGFLNATPEDAGDFDASPARTFGALQYVPTGVSDGFGSLSTGSPEHYPADVLWTVVYTLRAPYRANARWVMNSSTASVVRKFKDADGNYLWRDGLVEGQPPLLCGYAVVIDENMPDIGANAHPVAFGDFNRGYLIADQFGLRMTLDNNITTPGQHKFYVRKRVGGKTRDDDAIKLIKCATS